MNPHSRAVAVGIVGLVVLSSPATAIINGQTDGSTHRFVGAVDIRAAGAPVVASGVRVSPAVLLTAGHVTAFFDRAGQTRARVTFDPVAEKPDATVASSILWFDAYVTNVDRTPRNTNILVWHKRLWLIDHGAALYFPPCVVQSVVCYGCTGHVPPNALNKTTIAVAASVRPCAR